MTLFATSVQLLCDSCVTFFMVSSRVHVQYFSVAKVRCFFTQQVSNSMKVIIVVMIRIKWAVTFYWPDPISWNGFTSKKKQLIWEGVENLWAPLRRDSLSNIWCLVRFWDFCWAENFWTPPCTYVIQIFHKKMLIY